MGKHFEIRAIQKEDNTAVEHVVRGVFDELNVPKTGTAYEDPALKNMFAAYQKPRTVFFVVEYEDKVLGGAGIAPLDNYSGNVCELQKMYFSSTLRGRGIGKILLDRCLKHAKDLGFDGCYLETMPYMTAAQKLYRNYGFEYIDSPMGCTGHTSCPVYMFKNLSE